MHFLANFILNTSCVFHYDEVTVTSVINIIYGDIANESIPQGTVFCYSFFRGQKEIVLMPFTLRSI